MCISSKPLFHDVLPFQSVNNFEIESLFKSTRNEILDRLHNPVLLQYLKNKNCVNLNSLNEIDCAYYTEDEFNRKIKSFVNSLSSFHLNVRKIGRHRDELIAFLSLLDMTFDIIILTEVGKNSNTFLDSIFHNQGYLPFYDLPVSNDYGGVAIFIKNELNPVEMVDLKVKKSCKCSNCNYENVWVEFTKNGMKSVVGGIYRHPGGNVSHFNDSIDKSLKMTNRYDFALWGGDVNIDIIQQDADNIEYVTNLACHNYLPYITRPTRITSHSATLIDHMFVKIKENDRSMFSGNIYCAITDHLPNFIVIDVSKYKSSKLPRSKTRIFGEKNMLRFASMVYDTNWLSDFELYDDIDELCDFFMHNLKRYFDTCFPLVTVSRKRSKDKPWITAELRKCIVKKNRMLIDKLNDPSPEKIARFNRYRDIVDDLVSKAKLLYYNDVFENKKNSVKLLWDEFGPILGKKGVKGKNSIIKLVVNKKTLTDSSDIANAINKHFAEIGPKLASKIDDGECFKNFLGNGSEHSFFLKAVDETDVLEQLLKLNHRKSAGPDELSPKLVKMCSYSLYKPLTFIFNKSIASGMYPKIFKVAKLVPLYKAEKRCNPSNYRPISLLNCFDKVFEKLINMQLKDYLKRFDLLYEYQYAFREGYSTDLALLEFNDYVKMEIDKGNYVLTLFVDLKKAFDTVNHVILLKKLEHYGIRGHCNEFFASYLSNRTQYVHCNNVNSSVLDMTCGVPQGSVLGPTLFLMYVNDMINCIKYSKLQLFADDTITSLSGRNLHVLFNLLKQEIKNMMRWFMANKLSLNFDKTFYSIFHSKKSIVPTVFDSMTINGETIERKKSAKYLGLTFDEVLSWRHHKEKLLSNLSKYFYLFYNLRKVIPYKFKLQLFNSYVYSRVSYGLHCYGAACDNVVRPIHVVCNKLLKLLLLKDRRFPTNALYFGCNLLQVKDLARFIACKLIHKSIYPDCNTPVQLRNYFLLNTDIHDRDVRDKLRIRLPFARSALGQTSVNWYGSFYWNRITLGIRMLFDIKLFKKELKLSILDSYT